jgi:hypothetical protein
VNEKGGATVVHVWGHVRCTSIVIACLLLSGCGFLPGFGEFEEPLLYRLDAKKVANQVSCKLQKFVQDQQTFDKKAPPRWVLANESVKVVLTLQTDNSGAFNFTGVNVAKVGLSALQKFILDTTSGKVSVPSLGTKFTAKRTKAVAMTFTVSPKPTERNSKGKAANCFDAALDDTFLQKLYLEEWLTNYFDTINANLDDRSAAPGEQKPQVAAPGQPKTIPDQFNIQSVALSTSIVLAVDISGGAAPSALGNGSVFVLPINGLSLDYNPDFSHRIDITLNICDTRLASSACNPDVTGTPPSPLLWEQCALYARLSPLLSGVTSPKDIEDQGVLYICNKDGKYVSKDNQKCERPSGKNADGGWSCAKWKRQGAGSEG